MGIDPLNVTWTAPTTVSISIDRLRADALILADEGTGLTQCAIGQNVILNLTTSSGEHRTIHGDKLTDLVVHDVVALTRPASAGPVVPDEPVRSDPDRDPNAFLRAVTDPGPFSGLELHPSAQRPAAVPHLVAVPTLVDAPIDTSGSLDVPIDTSGDHGTTDDLDDSTILKTGPGAPPEDHGAAPGPVHDSFDAPVPLGDAARWDADTGVQEFSAPWSSSDVTPLDSFETDDLDDATIMKSASTLCAAAELDDATVMKTPAILADPLDELDDSTILKPSATALASEFVELDDATVMKTPAILADPLDGPDDSTILKPSSAAVALASELDNPDDATIMKASSVTGAHQAAAPHGTPVEFDDPTIISTSAERAALSALAAASSQPHGRPDPVQPPPTYRTTASNQATVYFGASADSGQGYPAAPAEDPAAVRLTATIGDSRGSLTYPLADALYVGRDPVAPPDAPPSARALAVVESPSESVSATHLRLRRQGAQMLVWDMWSTNGTTVFPPTAPPFRLGSGEELAVIPGTWLDLGDGVRVNLGGPGVT